MQRRRLPLVVAALCAAATACASRPPAGDTPRGSVAVIRRGVAVPPPTGTAGDRREWSEPYDAYAQDPPAPPPFEGPPDDHEASDPLDPDD